MALSLKLDNDSILYYIIVNYSYFLLYWNSWPQSQHNFLTLLIYSTEDTPSSAAWSPALRAYLPSGE